MDDKEMKPVTCIQKDIHSVGSAFHFPLNPLNQKSWFYKCDKIIPVATAAFSDSALPALAIVILSFAICNKSG